MHFARFCALHSDVPHWVGGAGGYVIHRSWISTTFSLFSESFQAVTQEVAYRRLLSRSSFPLHDTCSHRNRSAYEKEAVLAVQDNEIIPALDEQGRVSLPSGLSESPLKEASNISNSSGTELNRS